MLPLRNVRVIELAGLAPGPFCGMVLADFGASVIRVDKIGGSPPDPLGHGKRSISLNLKSNEGASIFRTMSKTCDVIIDPFRKGVMEKLKLGPQDLMPENKALIYARLTGFGQDGPYSNMAGHDINFLAVSGLLSLFGRYGQKPTPPINLAADFGGGGLMCALGIILALYERSISKTGQIIDASMTEGSAYLGSWFFRSQNIEIWGNPRGKNILDSGTHFYDTYETKDKKFMAVGSIEPQFYNILLETLNVDENEMPHFYDFEESRSRLEEIFKTKTQVEWMKVFDETDACVTPVLELEDVADHRHNKARKMLFRDDEGLVTPNVAPRLSRTPGKSRVLDSANPRPGDHTVEILSEYGYEETEIGGFMRKGIANQNQDSKL